MEVSESATFSPLVNDVNQALFAGAHLDSRAGSIASGLQRLVVVGTREIQTAADGRNYSRALQQNTLHYFRLTCHGATATGTFTTKVLPMGNTFSELIPLDSGGAYLFPSVTGVRDERIVDPKTGVALTLVNVKADNTVNSMPVPTAGGFGESCNAGLTSQGNYHCIFNDYPQGIYPNLYALNPTTGASLFLGAAYFLRAEIDPQGESVVGMSGGGERVMWDQADPNTAYIGVRINRTGRNTIVKWTYTGLDDPTRNVGAGPQQAPHKVVDLLGGEDLDLLAQTFNPALDAAKFNCSAIGLQSHYFLLRCARGDQNTYAWEGAYDIGNGLPLGAGGTGRVIAMAPGWARSGSRWCADHTYEFVGDVPVYSFAVHSLSGLSSAPFDGGGPYSSTLSTAMAQSISGGVSLIFVSSAWNSSKWGPQPSQWASGEPVSPNPDYFLQTVKAGDIFSIDNEFVKLIAKTTSSIWLVQRGVNGTAPIAHSGGVSVYAQCESTGTSLTANGGYLWWDFVASPDGSDAASWLMNFGSHPVSRLGYRVDSGYPIRTGRVTDKTTWGRAPELNVTSHPFFGGKSAPADGNSYQKHVSMASGDDSTFFDQTYFVGTSLFSAQNGTATKRIAGNLYQYRYETSAAAANGTVIARKHFPTLTKTAGHAFVDISGPNAAITGAVSDSYRYCVANARNECVSGSAPGDIFFNHPSLDPATPWCTGGENGIGASDICIGNFAANGLAAIQFSIANAKTNDATGALTYRPLTRLFQTYDGNLGGNLKLTYRGELAILFQLLNPPQVATRAVNVWAIHVPPVPASDGIDRGTFVPAVVSLTAPTGLRVASAQVRFWYHEQGGNLSTPYCTSRREGCVAASPAVNPANPFSYGATDSYSPVPCAVSCSIAIPVYPLHTAYYSAEFLDATGAVVSTSAGVAMEKTVSGF